MKTKGLFILFTLFISVAMIEAQNNMSKMFEKFSSNKDITSIIITKSMLNLIPAESNVNMNGMDLKKLSDKLDQVEIYTSEKSDACKSFRDEMGIVQKDKSLELLMSINEKSENVNFYAQKNGDKIKELIMFVNEPDECVIIRIVGSFTSEDIKKITKDMK
ncbi:hypothetical protein FACS1894174_09780 [Bacteroidia bacterium]|nr:hypothetical protein FACS1894203_4440 [Bacteroidia bacterium]GHT71622.1 hypothetical protein FACS189455_3870 [Bacteroidia bacterium]GHV23704.1 hypothetical protein FACS1894174_09780 [Bacteroidia bacterium]